MRTRSPGRGGRRTTRSARAAREQLDVVGRRDGEVGGGFTDRKLIERLREPAAVRTSEGALAARRLGDNAASTSRWRAAMSLKGAPRLVEAFERLQRRSQAGNEIGGGRKLAVGQSDTRIGSVQIGRFLAAEFLELRDEAVERLRQGRRCRGAGAARAAPRARAPRSPAPCHAGRAATADV